MILKKIKLNKNTKIIFVSVICVISAFFLLKYPLLSAEGIRKGLELSAQTMIPSLFPFLVVSCFANLSGVIDFLGEKTDKFFRKTFALSGRAGSIIFFGLFSGFPVGCSMAATLFEQNKITQNEAKRIVLGSVNAGPAFVIGAVGTMMLSSYKAGIIIFVSLTASSLIISFLTRFILAEGSEKIETDAQVPPLSEAFVSSVYSASKSMFSICGWIIVFSCILNILSAKATNENLFSFLKSVFEVSMGCTEFSATKNPAVMSAVIGWSGLCVHCQVLPYIIKTGLKIKYFFCARLLQSMLAALLCSGLLQIFPCEISTFSSGTSPMVQTFAVSAPAAAGLLLMSAIFILDLDTHKKMC